MRNIRVSASGIAEMAEFLNSQSGILFEFDDKLVRRIVDKVTVHGGRLTVEFKTGTEVSVEIEGVIKSCRRSRLKDLTGGFSL